MIEDGDVDQDAKRQNAQSVSRTAKQVATRLVWCSTSHEAGLDETERMVLASARAGVIAAGADHTVRAITPSEDDPDVDLGFSELLTLAEVNDFAQDVWRSEHRTQPLVIVTPDELPSWARDEGEAVVDQDASARWKTPPSGTPRTPEMGYSGPVAFLEVKPEGRRRLVVLHEIAHLLCDTEWKTSGHFAEWIIVFYRLISIHLGENVAAGWFTVWQMEAKRAHERLQTEPDWMVERVLAAMR